MQRYDQSTHVSTIVSDRPLRSRFFERLGIDYCCGGARPIGEVCVEHGLDARSVLAAIDAYDAATPAGGDDLGKLTAPELVTHIVEHHHAYLRRELPRLAGLSAKVLGEHGDREQRLAAVASELDALSQELEEHIDREERELFPLISGEAAAGASVAKLIGELEGEHQGTGDSLKRIKALTDGYSAPSWACNTFRAFYAALQELEEDVHEHVHEENNILFPRFMQGRAPASST